jgi:pyruvate/2-oxoglutarate dehydrogenase complex dihydrolipoamide acyltransferase (E2) component
MDEAVVSAWLVKVGDVVGEGDELAEIETDKAVNVLESPASGTVVEIVQVEGASVQQGDVIGRIEQG